MSATVTPAATTVIVAESETDAARLSMLYPACDIAVMPAGARFFTEAFAEQLTGYERVVVATDLDAAGDAGAARITALLPHAVRVLPTPGGDWCDMPYGVTPPTLPEGQPPAQRVGSITFTPILDAFDGKLPPPEVLVDDVLYGEGVHLLSGHPGSGKSIIAMTWATMVMRERRHVVWLDGEMGVRRTGERLAACGAERDSVGEFFHYAWSPRNAEKHLLEVAACWPGAMVVIDSVSKALKAAGIDENAPSEVTGWMLPMIQAAVAHGLPIVLIDHVAKNSKDQRYSRGSGSKLADVDVHWYMEKATEFNRDQAGTVHLKLQKDREAFLPFELWFDVGDGAGNLPVTPASGPPTPEGEPEL